MARSAVSLPHHMVLLAGKSPNIQSYCCVYIYTWLWPNFCVTQQSATSGCCTFVIWVKYFVLDATGSIPQSLWTSMAMPMRRNALHAIAQMKWCRPKCACTYEIELHKWDGVAQMRLHKWGGVAQMRWCHTNALAQLIWCHTNEVVSHKWDGVAQMRLHKWNGVAPKCACTYEMVSHKRACTNEMVSHKCACTNDMVSQNWDGVAQMRWCHTNEMVSPLIVRAACFNYVATGNKAGMSTLRYGSTKHQNTIHSHWKSRLS